MVTQNSGNWKPTTYMMEYVLRSYPLYKTKEDLLLIDISKSFGKGILWHFEQNSTNQEDFSKGIIKHNISHKTPTSVDIKINIIFGMGITNLQDSLCRRGNKFLKEAIKIRLDRIFKILEATSDIGFYTLATEATTIYPIWLYFFMNNRPLRSLIDIRCWNNSYIH